MTRQAVPDRNTSAFQKEDSGREEWGTLRGGVVQGEGVAGEP